jgi:hypothetical protein
VYCQLLTGFDAPILQAMYLDKGMRDHTLLQAIARVNRPYTELKEYGLILDYFGVFEPNRGAQELSLGGGQARGRRGGVSRITIRPAVLKPAAPCKTSCSRCGEASRPGAEAIVERLIRSFRAAIERESGKRGEIWEAVVDHLHRELYYLMQEGTSIRSTTICITLP